MFPPEYHGPPVLDQFAFLVLLLLLDADKLNLLSQIQVDFQTPFEDLILKIIDIKLHNHINL